jgi:isoleucyl-tRNA synthetase
MKEISSVINELDLEEIAAFEKAQVCEIQAGGEKVRLSLEDVEIISEDIPGWLVANEGSITVALDIHLTEELRQEGVARELINRIQNLRKESGFDVTDKIDVLIEKHELISSAVEKHAEYIGSQTLANKVSLADSLEKNGCRRIEIDEDVYINIRVSRL